MPLCRSHRGRHRQRTPSLDHPIVYRLLGVWLRSGYPSRYDAWPVLSPLTDHQRRLTRLGIANLMTAQCQSCSAPSPNAFLCGMCISELREMLTALVHGGVVTEITQQGHTASGHPWSIERDRYHTGLIEHLADAINGQAKLGESTRRSKTDHAPMRSNSRAAQLLDDVQNTLSTIVRDVCESRGVDLPPSAVTGGRTTPAVCIQMADWLAANTAAISMSSDASQFHADAKRLADNIERVINRPTPPQFCGRCDTSIAEPSGRLRPCGIALYARRDAIEMRCPNPACHTTHNIERLFNRTMNTADHMRWTREELIGNQRTMVGEYTTGIMGRLGEFVHYKMFQRWIKSGELKPAGYRRPDGRWVISRHSDADETGYRLADVRRLSDQRKAKSA